MQGTLTLLRSVQVDEAVIAISVGKVRCSRVPLGRVAAC